MCQCTDLVPLRSSILQTIRVRQLRFIACLMSPNNNPEARLDSLAAGTATVRAVRYAEYRRGDRMTIDSQPRERLLHSSYICRLGFPSTFLLN
jgi:hypothetical protein